MYRCPECRARKEFYVRRLGYRFIVEESDGFFDGDITIKATTTLPTVEKHGNYKMHCKACGHSGKLKKFVEAYQNPMKVFDTGNLCNCGGEIWQDVEVIKPTTEQSKEEFDGDQRKVSMSVKQVLRCERCKKEKDVR